VDHLNSRPKLRQAHERRFPNINVATVCISGEYVTLYQQQRTALRLRANEREGYMYQLARERIDLQSKLGELQSLVVRLLGERNMLHSYQTAGSTTASSPTAGPSVPSPAKRRRRTKHAHSQDSTATDGQSDVSSS